jgi:hypothetical protein
MDRLWRMVEAAPRAALEDALTPTDLQSLLLGVAHTRAGRVTPARVARRWREDRFVRPSAHDPRVLVRIEARLWAMLPDAFVGVELSPATPLGTCSAMATVDQNRVVATMRGTEVVSDPTNVLAVEAAYRRSAGDRRSRVDVAACHRVLRAQAFDGPGLTAHFKLFALVSTARDKGSGTVEAEMLTDHLRFWSRVLAEFVPTRRPRLTFTAFGPSALTERLDDLIRPALTASSSAVDIVAAPGRTQGAGYYDAVAIGIRAHDGQHEVDLGDGGITTWTASLLADAKERCVVSCIATERLAALASSTTI